MSSTGSTFAGGAVPETSAAYRRRSLPGLAVHTCSRPPSATRSSSSATGAPSTVTSRVSEDSSGPWATATDQTSSASSRTSSSTSAETERERGAALFMAPVSRPDVGAGQLGAVQSPVAGAGPRLDQLLSVLRGMDEQHGQGAVDAHRVGYRTVGDRRARARPGELRLGLRPLGGTRLLRRTGARAGLAGGAGG